MKAINLQIKRRIVVILIAFFLLFFALLFRLGWVQIVKGEEYKQMAMEQWARDIPIYPERGIIYDRNKVELAISANNDTVWARPADIEQDKREAVAQKIASILEMEVQEVEAKLNKNTGLLVVKRWINQEQANKLRELNIKGIEIAEDNKRYYPKGAFASFILGHTTIDSQGQYGLEQKYESILKGKKGRMVKIADAGGRELDQEGERYVEAIDGNSLVLTIDEVIQHYAEEAADTMVKDNMAVRGTVIVMDPKTGEILALAVTPDYDPNNPRMSSNPEIQRLLDELNDAGKSNELVSELNKMWRNSAISDVYEPGSTFKILTTAIGLEEGLVNVNSTFVCNGSVSVGGRHLKCWRYYRPHGVQTLAEGVSNSCNPVFIEITKRLQTETFLKYIDAFGFNDKTGIDLPGEGKGLVRTADQIGPVEQATMSYGQGISVTPIQLISAISAIANGGKLMEPRLVKEIIDVDGKVIEKKEPKVIRTIVSKETSAIMNDILEFTVADGGGKSSYVPGYRIAGKTGTANKVVGGGYGQGKYIASFVGFAPADDPQVAVLVIVDEPSAGSYYGGQVAAPVGGALFNNILTYLEVPPRYTEKEKEMLDKKEVEVPDLTNMNLQDAIAQLTRLNLKYFSDEVGENSEAKVIKDQFPKPGTLIKEEQIVYIYFQSE